MIHNWLQTNLTIFRDKRKGYKNEKCNWEKYQHKQKINMNISNHTNLHIQWIIIFGHNNSSNNIYLFIKFQEIKQGTLRTNILLDSKKIDYQFLLAFHSLYEVYLRAIDRSSTRLESKLMQSRDTDTNLRELMRLKNALIYFASSLRQNIIVAEKLMAQKNLTEDDIETLDNIVIEIKQAFATCNLQRELMTETMSTYSNIVSNQLAERMRLLTIVTIILAIPTLIAGVYGMNVPLPFDNLGNLIPFFIVCAFMIVPCILVAIFMIPNRHAINKPHKKSQHRKHNHKAKLESDD